MTTQNKNNDIFKVDFLDGILNSNLDYSQKPEVETNFDEAFYSSKNYQAVGNSGYDESITIKDRYLPIANVARIMKFVLPGCTSKVSKEAKELMQRCASEFISFVSAKAKDFRDEEKRKSIFGQDIINSLDFLNLEIYASTSRILLPECCRIASEKESFKSNYDEEESSNLD